MKTMRWMVIAATIAAVHLQWAVQSHAGLFKLDFSSEQNAKNGVTLTDWDTIPDWFFTDFPGGIATWKLTDFSPANNTQVTMTAMDNVALAAQFNDPAAGMGSNDPNPTGLDSVFDGIYIPAVVKDDYLWRYMDTAGTEMLFRFANLSPGQYHVTLFNGRVTDPNGQYGKIWIDDVNGKNEPADQNTGDYSANPLSNPNDPNSDRVATPLGHPQTLVVNIKAGDYLWFAHLEDTWGGDSGLIIRSWVDSDGDGIPDDWEIKYGLNPNDPSDAAKDPNGNGLSNLIEYQSALDPTDTTKPAILSAVANAATDEVTVTFSKPLFTGSLISKDPRDATITTNLANYSISPALAITGVSVMGKVVTLTTAKQTPSATTYTLTVNNVRDVNNWPVAANTQATFSIAPAPAIPQAPLYQWITIAGKAGSAGSDDGANSAAGFNGPNDVKVDRGGNLYVVDSSNHTIRKITRVGTNWVTTTIAGSSGFHGSDDGANSAARFNNPQGLTVDSAGNLYVADGNNFTIRKLTPVGTNWVTTTIAGLARHQGSADGANRAARFDWNDYGQAGVAVDGGGIVYVVDNSNDTIRKITPLGTNWVTTTIAGKLGFGGSADGANSAARFEHPLGVAVDSAGNLYVADNANATIRKVAPEGTNWVTTTIGGQAGISGSADGTNSVAQFNAPSLIDVDSHGNLYVADWGNNTIRLGVPLPVFRSVTQANGRIELTWSAAAGQKVQLQSNSDLASIQWTNLGNPMTATNGTVSASDTIGPDQQRFYRIVVLP